MNKPKQTGSNKPAQPKPQATPRHQPAQPKPQAALTNQPVQPPPPSIDRRLIGTEQRSNDRPTIRKVIEAPEKK